MPEKFLYETIIEEFGRRTLQATEIPNYLTENLNPAFELRPYQKDAFARFHLCFHEEFEGKEKPLHLLFNMATGSGKTLIMAGLMLYLYEHGYRNFLFFVNSTNIIEKTKDNFLNPRAAKYLFNENLYFDGQRAEVTEVANFEGVNEHAINICFTTIQKLHTDLTTVKENALTYEDFAEKKIVLLADEAHHINVQTKAQQELFNNWENTVERIFNANAENLLLEFTATHDYETPAMITKYRNKVINRYALKDFRNDRFSKDVVIVQSDFELPQRILQALLLSEYKQAVAAKHGINLKPVILFKAQRTIAQSEENKANFHRLIDRLTEAQIAEMRQSSTVPIVQQAFHFFTENQVSDAQLAQRLKHGFRKTNCLSVNSEKEKDAYQLQVNTLEDADNPLRAIFAVQKLNEGWDVLNLFDIVRCYEQRDSGQGKIGKTTISEAQLIGRGARYFPFVVPGHSDRFLRKFDRELNNELRVLEELHYHSINDSRYISEIRTALVEQGMLDENTVTRELKLKDKFKQTDFYNRGVVWLNERVEKNYRHVRSFADLGVQQKNYVHTLATGQGGGSRVLENGAMPLVQEENRRDVRVADMARNIVQAAIARNPFFTFASLKRYFPRLASLREFITAENYLGGLAITFEGNISELDANPATKLAGCRGLLRQIETEIRALITEYEGTTRFRKKQVHAIFTDKRLKLGANTQRAADDAQFTHFVSAKDWYAFNTLHGTSEEKAFVRMLARMIETLEETYEDIYLLRNEGHFAIYNFADGQAFQPDFVLFLRNKNGEKSSYQLFIEPKGKHLQAHDAWKVEFLKEICAQFGSRKLTENRDYRLIGVPFYNNENENEFREALEEALVDARV